MPQSTGGVPDGNPNVLYHVLFRDHYVSGYDEGGRPIIGATVYEFFMYPPFPQPERVFAAGTDPGNSFYYYDYTANLTTYYEVPANAPFVSELNANVLEAGLQPRPYYGTFDGVTSYNDTVFGGFTRTVN